ncbi:hypothetical protein M427DRAFT_358733 [Gonapodya prolifera JEL478]|uniref:Uncharacterized protein n=1 Tax=Gonapodya prolifera (strain JEL478) TaxID=1344416 RepID=A0A139ABL6_GONPJ|nr:hypothetical protein M427DRAFT_358733 [Gonapodya prolifera JEL478]|eukprot:KXS13865.1 hypothetical protein M427DRAFT_358733 [Gonapodya prolifera JEL478]
MYKPSKPRSGCGWDRNLSIRINKLELCGNPLLYLLWAYLGGTTDRSIARRSGGCSICSLSSSRSCTSGSTGRDRDGRRGCGSSCSSGSSRRSVRRSTGRDTFCERNIWSCQTRTSIEITHVGALGPLTDAGYEYSGGDRNNSRQGLIDLV